MQNIRYIAIAAVVLLAALALALSACGSGGGLVINQRAQEFVGGALSNFGGIDGASGEARGVVRDIAIAREFDFIQPGFVVGPGTITSIAASANPQYGDATGQLTVVGDLATATLNVTSLNIGVANVVMVGTFSVSRAQAAVADAGKSFTIVWTWDFSGGGAPVNITAEQTLNGTGWVTI